MFLIIERLKSWSVQSVNRRIFVAAVTVGVLAVIVRMMAVIKELVVARQFGTNDALDAFLIAYLIPAFSVSIVAGSFSAAFIPTYIRVLEQEGRESAQRLFASTVLISSILLFGISLFLAVSAPYLLPIIGSGFDWGKLKLTLSLFYMLLPLVVISGFSTIWGSILNAGERFALAALAPIMTPGLTVLILVFFGKTWGIYAMALGTIGGLILEALLLAWGLKIRGFSLVPRWYGMNHALRTVLKQYLPMVAGAFMMSGTNLVDQSMAAALQPGSLSALSYGSKVVSLIVGVGSLAIGTAVLPHFSKLVAQSDSEGARLALRTYTLLIFLLTVPLTFMFFYFSESIVRLLFERGAFVSRDTSLVGQIQAYYLLQIPFHIAGILGTRLMSAYLLNKFIFMIAAINLVCNIALNIILSKYYGTAGIALSTAIVYFVSCLLVYLLLWRHGQKGV